MCNYALNSASEMVVKECPWDYLSMNLIRVCAIHERPWTLMAFTNTYVDFKWCLTHCSEKEQKQIWMCKEMAKCLNLVNLCVCVLPVVVLAAGPLERWGPPAHGRCSGSRRRRTAALRREASGSAGRCGLSPAGSYSTAHRGQRTNREEVECCCPTFQQNFREVFKCQDKTHEEFYFFCFDLLQLCVNCWPISSI